MEGDHVRYFRLVFMGIKLDSDSGTTWTRLYNSRYRISTSLIRYASTYFCQSWSTLVSLESAFNADQEHFIIFAVTCTPRLLRRCYK